MRAALFYGPHDLRVEEVADPTPPAGGFLLKVRACALCGSDLRTFQHGKSGLHTPWILGHEIAGEVAAVGEGCAWPAVGERVQVATAIPCGRCYPCAMGWQTMCNRMKAHGNHYPGALAELMPVTADELSIGGVNRIPADLAFEHAAITEPLACVLNGQELVDTHLGDTVVVIGAGPIGCLHVQMARARGAAQLIQLEVNPVRLERARRFGADLLLRPDSDDVRQAVRDATGGRGADVVIIATPTADAQALAIELAAVHARISLFGGLPPEAPTATLNTNLVHYREMKLLGSFTSTPAQNAKALGLIAAGRIQVAPLLDATLHLDDILDGIGQMIEGKAMKVAITPNGRADQG